MTTFFRYFSHLGTFHLFKTSAKTLPFNLVMTPSRDRIKSFKQVVTAPLLNARH